MTRIVVPVRFPLSEHSRSTLKSAIEIAEEEGGELTVLHVNPFHESRRVTRTDLKRTVEQQFGRLPRTRYVVRTGFLIEQTILEEAAAQNADVVVIGKKLIGRVRRTIRRIFDEPDIEAFLKRELDCRLEVV